MTKMVMIAYNEAIDDEVMEALGGCALKNYTKLTKTYGKGTTSGTHFGNDIWPGLNNVLYVACSDVGAKQLVSCVRALRARLGSEGLKAFVMPVEDMT